MVRVNTIDDNQRIAIIKSNPIVISGANFIKAGKGLDSSMNAGMPETHEGF